MRFSILEYSAMLFYDKTAPVVEIIPRLRRVSTADDIDSKAGKVKKDEKIFKLPTGQNQEIHIHVHDGYFDVELL